MDREIRKLEASYSARNYLLELILITIHRLLLIIFHKSSLKAGEAEENQIPTCEVFMALIPLYERFICSMNKFHKQSRIQLNVCADEQKKIRTEIR